MSPCSKNVADQHANCPSKDMPPHPQNFAPIFFKNQFRTKIELPTIQGYPNVSGMCAIVTGSNTGLGLESAKQLLSLGLSQLIMGVRSLDKGNAAARELRQAHSTAKIEVWQLDMESYDSIQDFVSRCQESLSSIDMVILNAGISPMEFAKVSATGHEKTIQVNHLGTVLLAILLLPILRAKSDGTNPPRLTLVNSLMAHLCKFPNKGERPLLPSFDNPDKTPWNPEERYGVSKLLCQLFTVKLADAVNPNEVIINMVDPGLTKGTSLFRDARGFIAVAGNIFIWVAGRPVDRGAATYIDAVLGHGKESHGCFLMNCNIAP